jgi:hypothetical protein
MKLMAMFRIIAISLLVAIGTVLTVAAAGSGASATQHSVAVALDAHAEQVAAADCASGASAQGDYGCGIGPHCAAASVLVSPADDVQHVGSDGLHVSCARRRIAGRDAAPETGPPKHTA